MKLIEILSKKDITITGISDKKQKEYFQKATTLVSNILGINLPITIKFDKNFTQENGATVPFTQESKIIKIVINNTLTTNEKLLALCHELVHVKQFSNNELVILNLYPDKTLKPKADILWHGEKFEKIKYSRSNPWELEAHTKQRPLMMAVLAELGNLII